MKVTVQANQSLVDIAIQVYGSAEGVFTLAIENKLDVTDNIETGMILEYSPENVINEQVVQYYQQNNIYPANQYGGDRIFDNTFDFTFN